MWCQSTLGLYQPCVDNRQEMSLENKFFQRVFLYLPFRILQLNPVSAPWGCLPPTGSWVISEGLQLELFGEELQQPIALLQLTSTGTGSLNLLEPCSALVMFPKLLEQ